MLLREYPAKQVTEAIELAIIYLGIYFLRLLLSPPVGQCVTRSGGGHSWCFGGEEVVAYV